MFVPSSTMATTRKICEQETGAEIKKNKRARLMEDRFSDLPEALQLHILAFLNTKHAVQTSVLSRTWVSLWTRIPVLDFNDFTIYMKLRVFDKFVYNVLRHRDHSAKLDRLIFDRSGTCSGKILKRVFCYASLFGVKQLEVYVQDASKHTWPVCQLGSFHSLTSLKLQSQSDMNCPFLGPISGSFKNLTVLYLKRALITDSDSFSGFPVLESLKLFNCHLCMKSESKTLSIHAFRLSDLTISSLKSINCCDLKTPRLRFFDYQGPNFPLLRTHEGLPVLETVLIDFHGVCWHKEQQKRMFDDMVSLFCMLHDVKSLTLFSSVVHLLSLFPDELVRQTSPFRELNDLKLDFRYLHCQNLFGSKLRSSFEFFEVPSDVTSYLLRNSPDAKFTFTYPNGVLR
ncbi:hypothetical protein L2E82_43624 [Cichorium intybus]|uniref:Uncharacterized protein n=1 Tax=Cichorium intybus TaxID=13427 RepID=A0ACB8ZNT6_CICIN|nr:hypothetical protein L2E82_43624 [Cichorium intybus]